MFSSHFYFIAFMRSIVSKPILLRSSWITVWISDILRPIIFHWYPRSNYEVIYRVWYSSSCCSDILWIYYRVQFEDLVLYLLSDHFFLMLLCLLISFVCSYTHITWRFNLKFLYREGKGEFLWCSGSFEHICIRRTKFIFLHSQKEKKHKLNYDILFFFWRIFSSSSLLHMENKFLY